MGAKYIEIPLAQAAANGVQALVILARASSPIASGTNANAGIVSTANNVAGGTGYPVSGAGVATTVTSGGGDGNLTVTYTEAGGVIEVNSVVIVAGGAGYAIGNTFTINGGSGDVVGTVTALTLGNQLNDAAATFVTDGIVAGDIVYNVTSASQGTVLTTPTIETQLILAGEGFPEGGEAYAVRKEFVLDSVGATFTARKVRVGDIVKNTTAGTQTTVAALIGETSLTLTSDIFNSSTLFNDTFTIECLAVQVYDATQSFLTSVTLDDIVFNTTALDSEGIVSIQDDFRLTVQAPLIATGQAFRIDDQVGKKRQLLSTADLIGVGRGASNFTTVITYANAVTATINHSDAGGSGTRIVAAAIENALIAGAIGIGLPQGPEAYSVVLMPIFDGSQVVAASVVIA
tara:strand:+ start:1367 stop:2575 length:1209 start_codon:yes stop_codon:yes gene_type:complete